MNRVQPLFFAGHGGIRLAADAAGPVKAPSCLLLHGGGQTRHAWGKGQQIFAAHGYHAVSVDLRGHGDSEWAPDGDYSIETLSQDVVAVVRALGGRPVLIGASMGGCAALVAAGSDPTLAKALVLVDVTPRLEASGVARIHAFMSAHPDGFASLEEAAAIIDAYNPRKQKSGGQTSIERNLRQRADGRWHWHWDPAFIASGRDATVAHLSERMSAAAHAIRIPTLLVRGMSSDVVSHEAVAELRGLIPHLEFIDIAGAGHMVAGDRNDAFNAAILDFLKRSGGAHHHYPTTT